MKPIANQPCHDGAKPIQEEFVAVGRDGGLKNTFVYVESDALPKADGSTMPPAVLDQIDCRYVPHVIGVCVGQPLVVRSSDDTMHNVHYSGSRNESGNFAMTRAGQEKQVNFASSEFVPVKCDVHPWMNATIGVFDTPCFTVSGDDGEFELKNLPAGKYKLVTWHERYGRLEQHVNVSEAAPAADVELVYRAP